MYSEKQRRYPDITEEDHVLADLIQCDMAALSVNGCVSMPKNSVDICLVEEYLISSHCYVPFKCCCKLLEKRGQIVPLRTILPVA